MNREEQIEKEAKRVSRNGDEFHSFIQGAEFADETMIEKIYEWLKDNIDEYATLMQSIDGDKLEEKIVIIKSFKEDFMKSLEG